MKRWAFGWVLLLPLAIGGKSPQHSPLGDVPEPPPTATTTPVAPLPQEAIDPSGWLTSSLRLSLLKYYLSSYPSFESDRLDEQLMNYRRYLATHGAPDILIVGSSRALQGIDPAYLQQALIDQGYGHQQVYNFGINGATVQVVDFVLRKLLTSEQLPRKILWADGVRAFNSGRPDRTFAAIQTSVGYEMLAAGVRPPLNPSPSPAAGDCPEVDSPEVDNDSGAPASGVQRDKVLTLSEQSLHRLSRLGVCPEVSGREETAILRSLPSNNSINPLGFLAIDQRFHPPTYFQQRPAIPGAYDGDYANFSLSGQQAIAMETLLAFTRSQWIPVVFVSLPLTQEYLDPTRQAYENRFRQYMQGFADGGRLTFRDFSTKWLNQPAYFQDPSHLNRYGAAALAIALAKDPGIPWSLLRR